MDISKLDNIVMTLDESTKQRIASKIEIDEMTGCWNWTASLTDKGYGSFNASGLPGLAHRLVWTLFNGPIPDNKMICHKCNNKRCCFSQPNDPLGEKSHLMIGDAQLNVDQAVQDGLLVGQSGESNANAKLTREQALSIATISPEDSVQIKVKAQEYNVSTATIKNIILGKTWFKDTNIENTGPALPRRKPKRKKLQELVWTNSDIERFKAKLVSAGYGCIKYIGSKTDDYPVFSLESQRIGAHTFSLAITLGKWPELNEETSHKCANRWCVSPEHLEFCSRKENMSNPITRARISNSNRGNKSHAILTEDQIRYIKVKYRDDPTATAAGIARELNGIVTPECISNIRNGKTGTHVIVEGFIPRAGDIYRPFGEKAPTAKVTPEIVFEIRRRRAAGEHAKVIAEEKGLSRKNVDDITYGRTWTHLDQTISGYVAPLLSKRTIAKL